MKWTKTALIAVQSQYQSWLLNHAGVSGASVGYNASRRLCLKISVNGATPDQVQSIKRHLRGVPLEFEERVNLEPKMDSLDDLLVYAKDYAEFMRKSDQLHPIFLILSSTGSVLFLPLAIGNSKSKSVKLAQVVSIAFGATAVAFIGQGWISHTPGIKPSEALDRKAGTTLIGETYIDGKRKSVLITSPFKQSFSRIQYSEPIVSYESQGPFANILPKLTTPKLRSEAKELLRQLGITDETLQRQ